MIDTANLPTLNGLGSYYAVSGQLTPDGSRVYVLAYTTEPSPNSSVSPRVYVFDASSAQPNLLLLGHFDMPDYPACPPINCVGHTTAGAISLDGRALFFAGEYYLIVAPVPAALTPG